MNTKLAIAALLAPKCSGGTKIALQGFALMANDDGLCTATPSAVAKVVGLNRSTICRAIEPLLQIGYLVLVPNGFKVIVPDCDSVADCNNPVADCNNPVADCNNPVADCNNPVADCNNEKAQRKENPPQKSASLLPPTPPIITSNTLYTPSEEKKSDEGKAIGESEGGFAALPPPPSDSVFDVKEIAIDASRRLIAKGLSADEAIAKLRAVKVDFEGKAQALTASGDLAAKANPKGYLAAMWASMALEGPKPISTPTMTLNEPTTLEDIMAALRDYYRTVYPQQASHIDSIVSEDALSPRTIATIKAKEAQGWPQISRPQSWVQSRIDGEVYTQVQAAIEDDRRSDLNHLDTLRRRLADKQWERQEMERLGGSRSLAAIDIQIQGIETSIADVTRRLSA